MQFGYAILTTTQTACQALLLPVMNKTIGVIASITVCSVLTIWRSPQENQLIYPAASTCANQGVWYRLRWSPCGSWRSHAVPSWCPTSSAGNAVRRAKEKEKQRSGWVVWLQQRGIKSRKRKWGESRLDKPVGDPILLAPTDQRHCMPPLGHCSSRLDVHSCRTKQNMSIIVYSNHIGSMVVESALNFVEQQSTLT